MIQRNASVPIDQDEGRSGARAVHFEVLLAEWRGDIDQRSINLFSDPLDVRCLLLGSGIVSGFRIAVELCRAEDYEAFRRELLLDARDGWNLTAAIGTPMSPKE